MGAVSIFIRLVKWRFQNPTTIIMTLIQPMIWLLIFGNLFGTSSADASGYTSFILPGILIMSILNGAGISGIANYFLKENGSFYRVAISPVSRGSIVLGHIMDAVVLSFIQTLVLGLIAFFMSVRIETGFIGIVLTTVVIFFAVFFASSISYALSMFIPDENGFIAMVNTISLPLFFLSTALLDKENTSGIFKSIITINPFSYAIDCLRNLIIETNIDWSKYGITISMFFVLGIMAFFIAKISVKNEKI